jgi:gluconolactonase
MSTYKVEQVRESVMNISGKNVFYCHDANFLLWTDVLGGQICKLDLCTNRMSMCRIKDEKMVSFIVPIEGAKDQYVVGAGKRLLFVIWDGVTTMANVVKVLCDIPVTGVRINQCRVDRRGRLFFGTMISEEFGSFFNMQRRVGGLYRFTMEEGLVEVKDRVGLSNGIAWNKGDTKMFFVDSYDLNVYEFDYDLMSGNIGER